MIQLTYCLTLMTTEQIERWIKVSHGVASLYPINSAEQAGSVITIQQLARFEHDIDVLEEQYWGNRDKGSTETPGELDKILTYSYLWVLGAYEIIRTIAKKTSNKALKETRDRFARLRVPLAKLEASYDHSEFDYAFPVPVLRAKDIGWAVNPTVVETRKELSDALLCSLEQFLKTPPQPTSAPCKAD